MSKHPTLTRLTMNAVRNGYVTLLIWGTTSTMIPCITGKVTVRKGKRENV